MTGAGFFLAGKLGSWWHRSAVARILTGPSDNPPVPSCVFLYKGSVASAVFSLFTRLVFSLMSQTFGNPGPVLYYQCSYLRFPWWRIRHSCQSDGAYITMMGLNFCIMLTVWTVSYLDRPICMVMGVLVSLVVGWCCVMSPDQVQTVFGFTLPCDAPP